MLGGLDDRVASGPGAPLVFPDPPGPGGVGGRRYRRVEPRPVMLHPRNVTVTAGGVVHAYVGQIVLKYGVRLHIIHILEDQLGRATGRKW